MGMYGFRLFACDTAVVVRVQALEAALTYGYELGLGELTVTVGVRSTPAFAATVSLRTFIGADHAVAIGVETLEHLGGASQEFIARDRAVIIGIGPVEHPAMAATARAALARALGER